MGCDIHLYMETLERGEWLRVLDFGDTVKAYRDGEIDAGRNYSLFSVLANVRNGGEVKPFAELRGLPEDVSSLLKTEHHGWDINAHSTTWYGLNELVNADWSRPATMHRVVGLEEYRRWKESGAAAPGTWCASAFGSCVVHLSEAEAMAVDVSEIGSELSTRGELRYYVNAEISCPIRELCVHFVDTLLPALVKVADGRSARLVMWFDS